MQTYNYDEMKKKLKALVSESRYQHSIHVANVAEDLARCHKLDEKKAYIAGLLHDCAKDITPDQFKQYAINTGQIPHYDHLCKYAPGAIHSFVSAQVAALRFNVEDKDILQAIMLHTVGSKKMTHLDTIIYIADMIEPNRKFSETEEIRSYAYRDLEKAFAYAVHHKITHLLYHKKHILPGTIDMWNAIIDCRGD